MKVNQKNHKTPHKQYSERLRTYKLQERKIAEEFKEKKLKVTKSKGTDMTLEDLWFQFKENVLTSTKQKVTRSR